MTIEYTAKGPFMLFLLNDLCFYIPFLITVYQTLCLNKQCYKEISVLLGFICICIEGKLPLFKTSVDCIKMSMHI